MTEAAVKQEVVEPQKEMVRLRMDVILWIHWNDIEIQIPRDQVGAVLGDPERIALIRKLVQKLELSDYMDADISELEMDDGSHPGE